MRTVFNDFVNAARLTLIAPMVSIAALTACAIQSDVVPLSKAVPVASDRLLAYGAPDDGTIAVTIKRDTYYIAPPMLIDIDCRNAVVIEAGEKATLYLTPGHHVSTIGVASAEHRKAGKLCGTSTVEFSVPVDREARNDFRMSFTAGRGYMFAPTATD